MKDMMWNIFENTGSIEAYLYHEESKRYGSEVSDEITYFNNVDEKIDKDKDI